MIGLSKLGCFLQLTNHLSEEIKDRSADCAVSKLLVSRIIQSKVASFSKH